MPCPCTPTVCHAPAPAVSCGCTSALGTQPAKIGPPTSPIAPCPEPVVGCCREARIPVYPEGVQSYSGESFINVWGY
jgi:hypothetical protein